jgi:hypothetical protein
MDNRAQEAQTASSTSIDTAHPAPTERRIRKDTSHKQARDPPHRKQAPTVKPAPGATASTSALHQKPPSSNTTTTRALLTPPRIASLLPTASKGRQARFSPEARLVLQAFVFGLRPITRDGQAETHLGSLGIVRRDRHSVLVCGSKCTQATAQ